MKTPAENVIEKCGGFDAVRRMLDVSSSRVYRWTYPSSKGGTGGYIPAKHQYILFEKAREKGISLYPADFLPSDLASFHAVD